MTTGELGAWRTAIVHSGDVLNTAARIQGRAKEIDADLLVSEAIATRLDSTRWVSESLGRLELRGKEERVEVLRVRPAGLV